MLVLFETPAGYAFFKLLDEKKLSQADDLYTAFQDPKEANKILKLKHFEKFADTTDALEATTAAIEGKLGKPLKRALKKVINKEVQQQILLADAKVGNVIKDKFNVNCVSNTNVSELIRCIRGQTESLLSGIESKEITAMALGLAHSLSRYKLKFSPDKVDTMIIQAISLLDDLDKELNNYVMRCREWYGWHFPELGKLITDNVTFVKTVKLMGTRDNADETDLSDILPEDIEEKVKELSGVSMGTEIAEDDIMNIQYLCDQVIEISNYRSQLYEYLKSRMTAIAPNVTVMLGELVGARLISHAGSLINLAKQPASTIQIFGAEKALFRALKSNKETPKFGLIYHSSIVAGASAKLKGKISRTLAAKVALATRVDALADSEDGNLSLGLEHRAKVESRLRHLEEGNMRSFSGSAKSKAKFEKYHSKSEVTRYGGAEDSTITPGKRKREKKPLIEDITPDLTPSTSTESPKKKKIKKESFGVKQEPEDIEIKEEEVDLESSEKKKKKKKKKEAMDESVEYSADATPKKEPKEEPEDEEESPVQIVKKKKKKDKKKQEQEDE